MRKYKVGTLNRNQQKPVNILWWLLKFCYKTKPLRIQFAWSLINFELLSSKASWVLLRNNFRFINFSLTTSRVTKNNKESPRQLSSIRVDGIRTSSYSRSSAFLGFSGKCKRFLRAKRVWNTRERMSWNLPSPRLENVEVHRPLTDLLQQVRGALWGFAEKWLGSELSRTFLRNSIKRRDLVPQAAALSHLSSPLSIFRKWCSFDEITWRTDASNDANQVPPSPVTQNVFAEGLEKMHAQWWRDRGN